MNIRKKPKKLQGKIYEKTMRTITEKLRKCLTYIFFLDGWTKIDLEDFREILCVCLKSTLAEGFALGGC